MLEQVRFQFLLELLSFTHVGDGREFPLGKDEKGKPTEFFASIQRGDGDLPIIEASSIRGAMKVWLLENGETDLAVTLFGLDEVTSGAGGDGKMRLHAGRLDNKDEITQLSLMLPHFDKVRSCSFILPGIRIDPHSGAVEENYFYRVEMLPDGCQFRFSGTFLGSKEDFMDMAGRLFDLLAVKEGFELGGQAGYGSGRVRVIPESVTYETRVYKPQDKAFHIDSDQTLIVNTECPTANNYLVELKCPGPYFILDPYRVNQKRATDKHSPDMLALKRDKDTPVFTGKMFLQDLRRRSAWLENRNKILATNFDYSKCSDDNMNRHLGTAEKADMLTMTERLFGVAGWGKRVRVTAVDISWRGKIHKSEGIKLDVFTQGPIDSALISFEVPADIKVCITLKLDGTGLQNGDQAHFEKTLTDLKCPLHKPRFGHATGTGFGAFNASIGKCEEMRDG